ncbi:MAG: ferritin-like domain-containing protein [Desulfobacteraceae bacterium]|nr:MAG: ferritin-like domain-containing protein [Desulfobacteraceae bacterium]
MDTQALIALLNRDLADEHAAILRYLAHSYLEGEDTPLGAGLLSRCREEMWHMHWLGMIIGQLGGEPDMTPAPYPFDPTNRDSIFASYVAYEEKLIPHYLAEADQADDPHIRRVLQREAWESEMHAKKFARTRKKLSPELAAGLPGGENELPAAFLESLQQAVSRKYTQMLQTIRDAWVLQKDGMMGWRIMDFSFTKMKQLAHVAEDVAENGITPRFTAGPLNKSAAIGTALAHLTESLAATRDGHMALQNDPEAQKHAGLLLNLDLSIRQEDYEIAEIQDWKK